MKKLALGLLLSTAMMFADNADVEKIQNLPIVKQAKIKVEKTQEVDGIYYVKGTTMPAKAGQGIQRVEFFMTKNYKYLIMGKGIASEDGQPIRFPTDITKIKGKEAFSYGSGNTEIYVFTDPECPYCKMFEKKIPSLKGKYVFKIYMFPLQGHKEAIPMSKYILSAKSDEEKFNRLLEIANGSLKYQNFSMTQKENQRLEKIIEGQLELGRQAEITGTPSVMNKNGEMLDWSKL